ncbi:MAG: sulfur oxidation c-type cytochrome SoxA [Hyphomicrobiaceae bacterium]|nr:sulfur oxidation c-type cytochrome SoxA [Hyphomicrobiaceae bacterium]
MLRTAQLIVAVSLAVALAASEEIPLSERHSSYQDMSAETRAMQDHDAENPGMLWVLDGEALWQTKAGKAAIACAGCHGDAETSMKGVAARYPAYDARRGTAIDLAGRINVCRTDHQQSPELARESRDLLALTALVARQSHGLPIDSDEARLRPFIDAGRAIFTARQGQLDLACAHCHDANRGKKLAGITLSQGHPTGYPLYRLEWQTLGSLQRRLRNCLIGMRAEPYAYGAPEYIALEAYLMWRARGMPLESPAVRP